MILLPQSIERSQRSLSCESIFSRTGLDDYNIITDYANSTRVAYGIQSHGTSLSGHP